MLMLSRILITFVSLKSGERSQARRRSRRTGCRLFRRAVEGTEDRDAAAPSIGDPARALDRAAGGSRSPVQGAHHPRGVRPPVRSGVPSGRARGAVSQRYQPVEALRRGQATLSDFLGLVASIPRDLARLVKDARHGRMRVELDLKRLDAFGDRVHDAVDRATIGIMTASLVVGSSIVMTIAGGPTVFGVSLLTYCGLIGYLMAFVNSLWIILSIWRSGRR